jgi:hypothetical protein
VRKETFQKEEETGQRNPNDNVYDTLTWSCLKDGCYLYTVEFERRYEECKKKNKRFIFALFTSANIPERTIAEYEKIQINMLVTDPLNVTGHAGAIFIDQKSGIMERFEPHGYDELNKKETWFRSEKLNDALDKLAKKLGLKYISPEQVCPVHGPQHIQTRENIPHWKKGTCLLWSMWFLFNRLKYPEEDSIKLQERLMKQIKKEGKGKKKDEYTKFIEKFGIWLTKQFYYKGWNRWNPF